MKKSDQLPCRIQWLDDRAGIDTTLWVSSDDSCVDRQYFPTLFAAIRYAKKKQLYFVVHDGHRWIEEESC